MTDEKKSVTVPATETNNAHTKPLSVPVPENKTTPQATNQTPKKT